MTHYNTYEQLSTVPNFWAEIIAPYIASKAFISAKQAIYPSIRDIPQEVIEFETSLVTVIIQDAKTNEYYRIYLWYGTKNHAKSANALGKNSGKFAFIQTKIPHDIEFYDRYEILKECDPRYRGTFANERVNRILSTSDEDVVVQSDTTIVDVIQKGVLRFMENLISEIEHGKTHLCAVYTSSRIMKRGAPTVFRDLDVILGHNDLIRGLAEESSSGSDVSESEDSSDSDSDSDSDSEFEDDQDPDVVFEEIDDYVSRKERDRDSIQEIIEGIRKTSMDSDDSVDEVESGSEYDEIEGKLDDIVLIHNELIQLISPETFTTSNERVRELIDQMVRIGHIDYFDESSVVDDNDVEDVDADDVEIADDFINDTEPPKNADDLEMLD